MDSQIPNLVNYSKYVFHNSPEVKGDASIAVVELAGMIHALNNKYESLQKENETLRKQLNQPPLTELQMEWAKAVAAIDNCYQWDNPISIDIEFSGEPDISPTCLWKVTACKSKTRLTGQTTFYYMAQEIIAAINSLRK